MRFELEGTFDQAIEQNDTDWFWLLFGKNDCICASVKSLDRSAWAAVLTCDERSEPKVVGESLAYLGPYWQAYHVWMVLDGALGLEKNPMSGRRCDRSGL